jgi:hypothetical protein
VLNRCGEVADTKDAEFVRLFADLTVKRQEALDSLDSILPKLRELSTAFEF